MNIVKEGNFEYLGKEVEPDDRKRLALAAAFPTETEGLRYRVFRNVQGQILLDPVKSVPAYEAWIYENPEIIKSIQAGVKSIEAGRTKRVRLPKNIV